MPRRRLRRFIIASVISVSLCTLVAVLLMIANADALVRWSMMRKLCSDDAAEQQRGMNYMLRQIIGDDPENPLPPEHAGRAAMVAYLRQVLIDVDDACFDRIVGGLSAIGVWGAGWGEPWVRYLVERSEQVSDVQQSYIAVELGKMVWLRRPHHDDPRIVPTIRRLLDDDNADVRLNALSAAAALSAGPQRMQLLHEAAADPVNAIARRAAIMLALLGEGEMPAGVAHGRADSPPSPPADAIEEAKRLAELEAMATASADLPISEDMPYLIRLQTVRVSRQARPRDLMPLFAAQQPTLRDIAAIVAVERFNAGQVQQLAADLLASFDVNQRMGGAILAGLTPRDPELIRLLRLRAEHATDWIADQHYHLGLLMQGEEVAGFDPVALLSHEKMPRSTVVLALLALGRLEGLDWLLNPFGGPPVSLPMLLDQFRYRLVLDHFLGRDLPPFWFWADRDVQHQQAEILRDWYLLHRAELASEANTLNRRGAETPRRETIE